MKLDLEDIERKAIAARDERRTEESLILTRLLAEHIVATEPPVVLALIDRIRSLQAFVDAIPDETLQACKLYREQVPELYTDEDGNALYMDEAKRRILERGAVLP